MVAEKAAALHKKQLRSLNREPAKCTLSE